MIAWLEILLLILGLLFMLVAAVGLVRLPDVFCRLHVLGVLDTLGAPLIILAAAVRLGPSLVVGKLALMIAVLYLTAPWISHLLARAALEDEQPSMGEDPLPDSGPSDHAS